MSSRIEGQNVSWSLDDRLAVSSDKDIIIMKLDVFHGGVPFTGTEVKTQAVFSTTSLTDRPNNLWPNLRHHLRNATRDVKRELRQRWTYGGLTRQQSPPCWTSLAWSPPGLAPYNRTVLAGVTSDHRLTISGLSTSGKPWVQLADLGDQLIFQYQQEQSSHEQEGKEEREEEREVEEEEKEDREGSVYMKRCGAAAMAAFIDMTGLAPVDVMWPHVMNGGCRFVNSSGDTVFIIVTETSDVWCVADVMWSHVMEGEKAQGRCVLLFAAMKNGDIVTWNISLPCVGIESCCLVDRQRTSFEGTVCSLAWTAVPTMTGAGRGQEEMKNMSIDGIVCSLAWTAVPTMTGAGRGQEEMKNMSIDGIVCSLAWTAVPTMTGASRGQEKMKNMSIDGTVCSLAWTAVPTMTGAGRGAGRGQEEMKNMSIDGTVCSLACCAHHDRSSVDPSGPVDASPHLFTHSLHPEPDHLPVSALAWVTDAQDRLIVLSCKKDTLCAQLVSVNRHGNGDCGEGEGSGGWRMEMGACCRVAMGNGQEEAKLAVAGDTVVLASGTHIYHLAVRASSPTEVGVECVGEVVLQHRLEDPWACVSLALSPNTALVMALCRPWFAYNHLNDNFRCPIKAHISPLTAGWASLARLMSPLIASKMSTTLTDILQLACHTLLQGPVTKDTVTMAMLRLKSSPFSDNHVGWRVSRYLLSVLKSVCEELQLTDQVAMVMSAQQELTDRLLCHQISRVCGALQRMQSEKVLMGNVASCPILP
ncbi:hypothetical protein ACOMHN_036243 [Nucella lapillus]